ncbi:hypothetical protein KIN20_005635 [Parelaphostrongylus tenuis]|uniref:Uncharacterized protein n=1 Tax=Parelaphostrongylus tenuis TaxID=148309 RepID=A0AAD5M0N5_PARTN|nr:hypothetical protein KIN20_005635 [Parelaphostrongylus tenuis]
MALERISPLTISTKKTTDSRSVLSHKRLHHVIRTSQLVNIEVSINDRHLRYPFIADHIVLVT